MEISRLQSGEWWVTGLEHSHVANHAGCKSRKLVAALRKHDYKARQRGGCVATNAPVHVIENLLIEDILGVGYTWMPVPEVGSFFCNIEGELMTYPMGTNGQRPPNEEAHEVSDYYGIPEWVYTELGFPVFGVNERVKVLGTRWQTYQMGHAPTGGRTLMNGPSHTTPFAFIFPVAHVIDHQGGTGREFANARTVNLGGIVVIEGYGAHKVVLPDSRTPGDDLKLERLSDGFRS